jgi:hypothetical protein
MVGTGSRLFFALGVLGFLGAGLYGIASGGDIQGVISMGWKGGVGDHFGYALLVGFGTVALVQGVITVAIHDADPLPVAVGGGEAALPEAPAPVSASPWPIVGALGLVLAAIGLVEGALLFVTGLVLIANTIVEWLAKAWSDRATGDRAVNLAIRNRVMAPVEIPIGAALIIGFVVVGISRVFLATSANAAAWIAIAASVLIMAGAILVYKRPQSSAKLVTVLLVIGAIAVVAGGIAGVAAGSREFHEHEPAHEPSHEGGE